VTSPILATKLYVPRVRPNLVPRPRLIARLNKGLHRKLTLISAPAGFGKTTLVCEWLDDLRLDTTKGNQNKNRVAWISLDENDSDPARFLTYFIAALRLVDGIENTIGEGALNILHAAQPQPSPITNVLTLLVNEIAAIPDSVILILDDYHTIESSQVDDVLVFLLENSPPQLHLVIATRTDPIFPLARLRAQGQFTELRANDLRFTSSETSEFLNQIMGLNLSTEDIAVLETRIEGWISGLQLAAISLQGKEDTTRRIKSFSGSHRLVLDYLIEEVLDQQPESVQTFLLQTAILDQLSGSLCDAVRFDKTASPDRSLEAAGSEATTPTDQNSGQVILEMLERANLFIVPLDEERCWYRYHHLFSDLLRQRLKRTQSEHLPILHHRASEWYEQNGFDDEAIEHALRAEDFERTAHLIETVADAVWARGGAVKLRRWLDGLPDELVLSKPHLCIFRAWELFASGRLDAAESFLQAAGLAYDPSTDRATETESLQQDQPPDANRLRVGGRAAAIQAWMAAYRRHNVSGLIQHLRQALEHLPERDLDWHSAAATTLGDVHAFRGDMPAAYQARLQALKACEAAGNTYLYLYNSAKLALNLKAQGRLLQVQELCQGRVRFANESGISQTAVVGWLLALWGEVLAEINELDGALDRAEQSIELTERGEDVQMLGWSRLCLTRILFSRGDMAGAEEIVQKMNYVARASTVPTWIMNLNAAWQSRIWLAKDDLEAASQWVREQGLESDKQPTHLGGFAYIALARILIAQGRWDETTTLLQRMLEAAEAGGNTTGVIEMMILQALAFQAGGDTAQAMITLERALTLAEPRGFYRIFVDEGPSMAPLLYTALDRGIAPDYVRRLLGAFPIDEPKRVDHSEPRGFEAGYIERLTDREIEVLQLVATGLTNAEIATRLFLSLHTVKTHTRNIYGKLGVHTRTEAVARARALGILPST
jgi:LuxR family maltose regulon positive regulatory protein